MKKQKILIIAGGGVFGIIPARFMLSLEQIPLNVIDVFGGTSIGGILSIAFAQGMTTQEVYTMFKNLVGDIFHAPWYRGLNPFGAKYSAKALEKHLKERFPGSFGALKKRIFIPTLDFQHNQVKVYDNIVIDKDLVTPTWEVARATSAAPTFFAPFDCKTKAMIDGGLLENLPIITTCSGLKAKAGIKYSDMHVLALGTGFKNATINNISAIKGWSALGWARPMVDMLTDTNEKASEFWAKQLGLGYFDYFNPVKLDSDWKMDDLGACEEANAMAGLYVTEFTERFEKWLEA